MERPSRRRWVVRDFAVVALLVLAISACQSGNSPTAPDAPMPSMVAMGVGQEVFAKVNGSRLSSGLPPVASDSYLDLLAEEHSAYMSTMGLLTHQDSSGAVAADRLQAAGVVFVSVGENVGRSGDAGDPAGYLHALFMASPTHRRNVLDPAFSRIGIGVASARGEIWLTEIFVDAD